MKPLEPPVTTRLQPFRSVFESTLLYSTRKPFLSPEPFQKLVFGQMSRDTLSMEFLTCLSAFARFPPAALFCALLYKDSKSYCGLGWLFITENTFITWESSCFFLLPSPTWAIFEGGVSSTCTWSRRVDDISHPPRISVDRFNVRQRRGFFSSKGNIVREAALKISL